MIELKRYFDQQNSESAERPSRTNDEQCQTQMMDVRKEMIFFRNNQASDGELLQHSGTQTRMSKQFSEMQIQTELEWSEIEKTQLDLR